MNLSDQQIVILAGGLGTRLKPLTETCPKPLVPVCGLPFLHWQLEDLKIQGARRVLLLVSYLGEQIEQYFGDGSAIGMEITYAREPQPLGTGGALKNALAQLDNEFVLLNGDSFLRAPLAEMIRKFREQNLTAAISVFSNVSAVPVIPNLRLSGDLVSGYQKDAGLAAGYNSIDSGIYVMKKSLISETPGLGTKFMLADLWPKLIDEGKLGSFAVAEKFYDIGTVPRLKEFEEKVRDYFPNSVSS